MKDKDKLAFNVGKYIRKWGIEFVLTEIVDWMEAHDQTDPKFVTLTKDLRSALTKYKGP
jgi:hypothetical protein